MAGVHPGDITWHRLVGLIAKRIIPDPTEGTRGMRDASPEDRFGFNYGSIDVCPILPSSPPGLNVEVASLFGFEACVCVSSTGHLAVSITSQFLHPSPPKRN